jgi:methionine synthase II (cobalamin-independent)
MRERSRPPFRADHVGSLLRPPALKAARRDHAAGLLDSAGLAAVEDREIERVIRRQEEIRRRIDAAARFVDLDPLCLSGQCGFASTEEGNLLTEDEQWAKLARIVEVAHAVWD